MRKVIVIKGAPSEQWEAVQAIQQQPFIYIMSNGSRWMGEEAGDIQELLDRLANYRLDVERFGPEFHTVNPCYGVRNPKAIMWEPWTEENPHYIDGPRLYPECEGVVRFFGNFENYSHVFDIDTNHKPTIDALMAAIQGNADVREVAA